MATPGARTHLQEVIAGDETAVDALHRATEYYRRWGEAAADGVWVIDTNGQTAHANSVLAEMLGYSLDEIAGLSFFACIPEEERDAAAAFLERRRTGSREHHELRLRRRDGSAVWTQVSVTPSFNRGEYAGALVTVRDIGERRRALEELGASEERFRSLVACADDTIVMTDLEGRISFVNEAGRRLYGTADVTQIIGQSAFDLLAEESRAAAFQGMQLVLDHGVARHREYLLVRPDGSRVPVEMTVSLMRDANGVPCGFMSITRDISERRRAEERAAVLLDVAKAVSGKLEVWEVLDRVQQRVAEVLDCDFVATFSWDPARLAFRVLGQYQGRTGLALDARALEFRRGVPFVDRLRPIRTVVINGTREQPWVPRELLDPYGITALVWTQLVVRERPIGALVALSTAAGFRFDAAQVELLEGIGQHLAVAMEAAELYQTQLRQAEVSAALARVGREMIAWLDRPDLLEHLCQLTCAVLQCGLAHTLLYDPVAEAYSIVASHGYSAEQQTWINTVTVPRSLLSATLDNLSTEDAVRLAPAEFSDNPLAGLAEGLGLTSVLCMALRQGTEVIGLHVAADYTPRLFAAQDIRIAQGIAQLASLTLQYRRLLEELQGADRLKSDFVATLSHELRSPFNIIIGYGALLLDRAFGDLTSEQAEVIERMDRAASGVLELLDTTLDLSRLDGGRVRIDLQTVNLGEILAAVDVETRELRATRPAVQFMWRVAPGVPSVRSDPVKLKVVLKNLVANAFKFTLQGRVTVEVQSEARGVAIHVIDTGRGIPPDALPVIFEAFRQAPGTSAHLGGVGLGLYIVRRLLEILGGTVQVDSRLGEGTTFHLWLPIEPSRPGAASPS